MRKLVYWCAAIKDDRPSYNIRARTRKEAKDLRQQDGPEHFGKVTKVTLQYKDAFDLAKQLLGEGGSSIEPGG